jgi:hypothetical protein
MRTAHEMPAWPHRRRVDLSSLSKVGQQSTGLGRRCDRYRPNRLSVRATIGSQVRLRSRRVHLLEPAESPGPTFQRGQRAVSPVLGRAALALCVTKYTSPQQQSRRERLMPQHSPPMAFTQSATAQGSSARSASKNSFESI